MKRKKKIRTKKKRERKRKRRVRKMVIERNKRCRIEKGEMNNARNRNQD